MNDLDDCDLVVLWDECRADFTRSCKKARSVLADLHIPFVDDALRERIVNLGRTGCAQGIAYDCAFLAAHGTRAEGLLADETRCRHDHAHCHNLARRVFLDGDVARAHRLLEYTCQQGIMAACERLGALYVKRELREPVDGRGVRLLELACRFRIDKGALFKSAPDTYFQQCMDRTGMWETYDRAFYAPLERVEPP